MEAITFGRFLRKCLIDVINRIESDFLMQKQREILVLNKPAHYPNEHPPPNPTKRISQF